MSALFEAATTAGASNGIGLPEIGGASGILAAGLILLEKVLNYRAAGRAEASKGATAEREQIAEWAGKLLVSDMEARKEDGADRRAITLALAGVERQMVLQTELLRQIQGQGDVTQRALLALRPLVAPTTASPSDKGVEPL